MPYDIRLVLAIPHYFNCDLDVVLTLYLQVIYHITAVHTTRYDTHSTTPHPTPPAPPHPTPTPLLPATLDYALRHPRVPAERCDVPPHAICGGERNTFSTAAHAMPSLGLRLFRTYRGPTPRWLADLPRVALPRPRPSITDPDYPVPGVLPHLPTEPHATPHAPPHFPPPTPAGLLLPHSIVTLYLISAPLNITHLIAGVVPCSR